MSGSTVLPLRTASLAALREPGVWPTYLYLLVTSGALFPLRFIPINYEWIIIAASLLTVAYQVRRFGPGQLGQHRVTFALIGLIVVYQSAKALASPEEIDPIQFLRALYGQLILGVGIAVMATNPLSRERILGIATNILPLLTALVLLSIATGFRFYATGFLPEANGADIREEVASGNYRIITYYSTLVVFLFFAGMLAYLRTPGVRTTTIATSALVLILLTGTRSLIAPTIAVGGLVMLRHARPTTTIAAGIGFLVLAAAIYAAIPDLVSAYLSRFYVGEAFDAWRALEQELVRRAIGTAPLFGLAMGTPYSHVMSALAGGTEGYSLNADYDMHNEYLWLMLYFGVVGCALLVTLVVHNAYAVYRKASGSIFATAFFAYLFVMLASMNYSGILLKGYGGLLFGLVIGLCLARPAALAPLPPGALKSGGIRPAGHSRTLSA